VKDGLESSRMNFTLGVALFIVGVLLLCWFLNRMAPQRKDGILDHEASNMNRSAELSPDALSRIVLEFPTLSP